MKNYKFSVLLPTYNGADIVKTAIDSVLKQDYQNFEIIVSDDNSKDETIKVVRSYKDKRIKVFINKKNLGVCGNLNQCLKYAKGDIIYPLGQDDFLSKDALSSTNRAFNISPEIGGVTRPYRWYDPHTKTTIRRRDPLNPNKDEVVYITDSLDRVKAVFKNLDSLTALGYRRKFMKRPFHKDIFPTIADPFAAIFKKHPVVFLHNYVSSVTQEKSQTWIVSSIYEKSPVLSWAQMFDRIFPEKKFEKVREYCKKNFVAANYVGLAQIRNYSKRPYWYTVREIYYLAKINSYNLLKPKFWIFSLGALITPRFILIPVAEFYKRTIGKALYKNVRFKTAVNLGK